jgi:sec-independent protein translocase protein TatB
MGNLGGGEILVLLVVGLLVLGPERLPEATRQVGKALRHIRRVTTGFQEEIRSAVEDPVIEAKARLSGDALLRETASPEAPEAPQSDPPRPDSADDASTGDKADDGR